MKEYTKYATTLDEQIAILRGRGMVICDEQKAKEVLLDIGYYRIGFYTFPYEIDTKQAHRDHRLYPGTSFEQVVDLYYFDHDLRHILMKYISRIEVNIRTYITYTASNYYKKDRTWFVSPGCVKPLFRNSFEDKIYRTIRQNPCISGHHKRYKGTRYAPAWKTMEFMTFGSIISLYENLQDQDLKVSIARHYGIYTSAIFENYLQTLKVIRNACAHGNHIYDLTLIKAVRKGVLKGFSANHRHDIYAGLQVLLYFLHCISIHREQELKAVLKMHIGQFQDPAPVRILQEFCENVL